MGKARTARRIPIQPLAAGQVWHMDGLDLQVTRVGPILVNYKLAKPNAIRIPNQTSGKSTVCQYLKRKKAVLGHG